MNTFVSYLHLLGCVGWTVFLIVAIVNSPQQVLTGDALVASIALLLTTASGIYLFAIGRTKAFSRINRLELENAILEKEIRKVELKKRLDEAENGGEIGPEE